MLLNWSCSTCLTYPQWDHPAGKSSKARKAPITLDFIFDAVMSNGMSLSLEDGWWYNCDGGAAWSIKMVNEPHYTLEITILSAAEAEHDTSKVSELDKNQKGYQRSLMSSAILPHQMPLATLWQVRQEPEHLIRENSPTRLQQELRRLWMQFCHQKIYRALLSWQKKAWKTCQKNLTL